MANDKLFVTMVSKTRCFVLQKMCKDADEAELFWNDVTTEYTDDDWTWIYNPISVLVKAPIGAMIAQ